MKKNIFIAICVSIFILLLLAGFYLYPSLRIATGYAAKYTCSYTFLAGMEYEKIKNSFNFFPVNKVTCEIDSVQKKVTASVFGIAERKAYYYEHGAICGCVLDSVENINRLINENYSPATSGNMNGFEFTETIPDSVASLFNISELNKVLTSAIDSNRAILAITVAYKNFLIAEKYTPGVTKNTRLLGWSMTKTITNALFGILEKNGILKIEDNGCLSEWKNDERKEITINNLLQMSSGLEWKEDYSMKTDVTQMLYLEPDIPLYAGTKSLTGTPGEKWYYSSGTTNILSGILRLRFNDYSKYLKFPMDSLFNVIGMSSAVVEMDNAGNYVFSSYGWATARDWTKFGLLYLYKGNWFGKQVFTEEWANYGITPAKTSNHVYGAQLWLNGGERKLSSVPDDGYFASGYGGQKILVLPSQDMVIVVLSGRQKEFDFNGLYEKALKCRLNLLFL